MKSEQLTNIPHTEANVAPAKSKIEERLQPKSASRRKFLKTTGLGAAALTAGALAPVALTLKAEAVEILPDVGGPSSRARQLVAIRTDAANEAAQDELSAFPHPTNGDEER